MKFFRKIKDWFVRHKPTKRRLIQVYAALLYNANIKGFVSGSIYTGNTKYVCVPGLNCYSCPGAVGACPLGALQNALASSNTKAPFYVFGILILFGLLLGRTICGFLCPIGLMQDLLYKIKSPKLKKNKVTRVLSYLKYVVLAVMVILIPLAYAGIDAIPAFCKYICPSGTLLGSISLLANSNNGEDFFSMLGPLFTWKFCVLVLIVVGSIFIYRIFCRFLCPLGAIYSFFCRVAMLGIKLDKQKCIDCGLCVQTCKMDIKHVGDHECIHCGDCLKVCPTKAISWKGSKIFLHPNAIDEKGESAQGEKVALTSLLASSTANGGTLAVNAGGTINTAPAPEITVIAPVVSPEENVTDKQEDAEEVVAVNEQTAAVAKVPAKPDRTLRLLYIYGKNSSGWKLKSQSGVKSFLCREHALRYAEESANGHPAFIYVQRQDGSFALTIRKGRYVAEDVAAAEIAVTEDTVAGNAAEEDLSVTCSVSNEIKPDSAEQPAVQQEQKLTKAQLKENKKLYHRTLTYQKKRNKMLEIGAWALALIILAAALVYYNFIDKEVVANTDYTIGDTVASFTMKKYFGGEDDTYTLQDDLNENRIVILNFWYITCAACEAELPELGELAGQYPDDISLVVVHSSTVQTSALTILESYVTNTKGWTFYDYDNVHFTLDNSDDQSMYVAFDGTNAYPMTVVLDGNGVMRYRYTSSITDQFFEDIQTLLDERQ